MIAHFGVVAALLLCLLGFAVGIFGTLVGAGGGFILTPVLLLLYPQDAPALITAISLVAVFFKAGSGSIAYARQLRIDYRSGLVFALATLPGAVLGVITARAVSRPGFDVVMGLVLIGLAGSLTRGFAEPSDHGPGRGVPRSLIDREGKRYRYRADVRLGAVLSVGVGFLSSFLGIGGGVIHVPLLVAVLGFPPHVATATSHFVLAIMALVATITHAALGTFHHTVGLRRAAALAVGVVVGAQIGAILSQRLSGKVIQRLLAVGLLLLGLRLLLNVAV